MSRSTVSGALAFVGALLVVGGLVEAVDLIRQAWSSSAWSFGQFGLAFWRGRWFTSVSVW